MRGLKRDRTASVVIRGHAFLQNLRRGHELGIHALPGLTVAAAFVGGAQPAPLRAHLAGVGSIAESMAANLGFGPDVRADLRRAGELHDAGKADPRFQQWLHAGDPVTTASDAADDMLLAKSTLPDTDRQARTRARIASGYPSGARHELLSREMISGSSGALASATDPDLVRYLVVSHHGYGRYRFDPVEDDTNLEVRLQLGDLTLTGSTTHCLEQLDRGLPDAFWALVRRYGWYQLAWLETVLRLADHQRSRAEQDGSAFGMEPSKEVGS